MAFQNKDLSVLAYANGFTSWHYITADAPTEVIAPGYFNGAADLMRAGDLLTINAGYGAAPANFMLSVTSNSQGVPVVAPLWSPPVASTSSAASASVMAERSDRATETPSTKARILPYTDEDERIDPEMAGLVMLYIGRDGEIPDHVLDRIPEAAAKVICGLLNAKAEA